MVKRHDDDLITRPLPGLTVPWLVILSLLAGMVLMYLVFLHPGRLLGTPLPPNEYIHHLAPPPAAVAPAPPASSEATPQAEAEAVPVAPPSDAERVIGE